MSTDTTEAVMGNAAPGAGAGQDIGLALVVVWCRDEPDRAGEVLWFGPSDSRTHVFGRGADRPADPSHVRATLVRQRPGANLQAPPLQARGVSREQLHVHRVEAAGLALDNRGRRALLVADIETPQAVVRPGDVVMIEGQLLLLCAERPQTLPPLRRGSEPRHPFGKADGHGIVGESPSVWALRDAIATLADDDGHVLVHGPAGACKERVARALHAVSPRREGGLVVRDVAAIPEELVAFELFGHEGPGDDGTPGLVEYAAGATLLLDDFGGAAAVVAPQLQRLLTTGEFRRAGDPRPRQVDVRVVATLADTPDALPASLRASFPSELRVPSLAERRADVTLVARHLLRTGLGEHPDLRDRFVDAAGEPRIAPGFLRELVEAPPAGGMRALDALLWRALVASPGEWVIAPPDTTRLSTPLGVPGGDTDATTAGEGASLEGTRNDPRYLPPALPESVVRGLATLTDSERVALQRIARGESSREIAARLYVSVRTVQQDLTRLCDKLGLGADSQLLGVAAALGRYLGPPEEG
ncbi:MAG: LuxR family transcriptional regulator [Deltaproteobacteria bacterium]|nr:MAG: LuxR family transcriptional regulator [Deltaproteobacteria bacterium]